MDFIHAIYMLALGRLHLAPIVSPGHVLDIDTGTGIWALNFENWEFFHNDLNYVHMRSMGPSFNDFPEMIKKIYRHTRPGGWIELQDGPWEIHGAAPGSALQRYYDATRAGAAMVGRDLHRCVESEQSKAASRWSELLTLQQMQALQDLP
jgi:ubiquinone/menaquinone biosynthesis C-methylase UbiE